MDIRQEKCWNVYPAFRFHIIVQIKADVFYFRSPETPGRSGIISKNEDIMATAEKTKLYKNFTDLVKDFKQGKTSRLYLFFGEERFLMEMALAHLKKFYLAEGAESFDFYMKDQGNAALDLEEFSSLVGSPPFLSKARVTVIRNSGWWGSRAPSNAKEQEAWKAKIASIPEYSCVVFLEDKVDKRKKSLVDAVSQNGEVFEFMIQSEEDLSNWIRKQLSSANISISPDCVSSLISRVDSSMRMLRNEVLKIILYCENKGVTKVDMPLLDKLSIPDVHASVFKMTDAIGMKDAGSALLTRGDSLCGKDMVYCPHETYCVFCLRGACRDGDAGGVQPCRHRHVHGSQRDRGPSGFDRQRHV